MKEFKINYRKRPGAIVWHEGELKMITNQQVEVGFIILENLIKVDRHSVRLAKIGDMVKYKDLTILPERCAHKKDMRISYIKENGIIVTDKCDHFFDGSAYSHFIKP